MATQPRVLRIGIVQDRQFVQEKILKPGETVTIGESSANTFVFPPSGLPEQFALFRWNGSAYELRVTAAMKGKLVHQGAERKVESIRSDESDGAFVLVLTDQDKGKIELGDVTVLFQFTVPPPVQAAQPMQTMDFRPRWMEEDDAVFVMFMGVWWALGAVFALWVSTAERPEPPKLEELPERFARILLPPKVDKPIEPITAPADGPTVKDDSRAKAKAESDEPAPENDAPADRPDRSKAPAGSASAQVANREATRQQVIQNSAVLRLIGTTGRRYSGTTVGGAGDDSYGDVDALLRANGGQPGALTVGGPASGLKKGPGVGGGVGTTPNSDIGGLGGSGGAGGAGGAIAAAPKVERKANVASEGGSVEGEGEAADAVKSLVRRRYASQLKYCYENELRTNADLAGRVVVEWTIEGGKVSSVVIAQNTTGSASLAQCIENKVKRWTFDGVEDATTKFPFVFSAE